MLKNTMIITAALALLSGPAFASGDEREHHGERSAEHRQHEMREHRSDSRHKSGGRYERRDDRDDADRGRGERDRRKNDDKPGGRN